MHSSLHAGATALGLTLACAFAAGPAAASPVFQTYSVEATVTGATGWSADYAPASLSFSFAGTADIDPANSQMLHALTLTSFSGFTIGETVFDLSNVIAMLAFNDENTLLYFAGDLDGEGDIAFDDETDDFVASFFTAAGSPSLSPASLEVPLASVNITNADEADSTGMDDLGAFGSLTVTTQASAVPLPAAAPLLAGGLAGLGLVARRKQG